MRGKQKKRLLALMISLAMLFTLTPFTPVAAADDFTADSGVFRLVGDSINDHTNAFYLWEHDNWVYIALVTANHTTGTTLTVNNQIVTERWFLDPGEALVIYDNGNEIFSEIPTGKNAGTAYYWMVGRLPLAGLDLSSLIIDLDAPGGFKLDNVTYTVEGALNVYHEYLFDPPELDLDQSVGSNSLAGLAAGTYEADPVLEGDYAYIGLQVTVGGNLLFTVAAGATGSGSSGVVSVAADAAGKVTVTLSDDYDGVINILFRYEERVNIDVSKVWQDDSSVGDRPDDITVRLWRAVGSASPTEVTYEDIEPDQAGIWGHAFTGQPKYDPTGQLYIYSITEDSIDGYSTGITGNAANGFTITNTRSGLVDFTVTKVWYDDENAEDLRPQTITIRLMRKIGDGTPVQADFVSLPDEHGAWTHTFEDQDKYDDQGKLYIYSVTEDEIPNYSGSLSDLTFTNTLTGTIDIDVSKLWQDDDDSEDLRPDDITIRLHRAIGTADPAEVEDVTIEPDNDGVWAHTFEDQDKYDSLGRRYIYSITEDSIDNYASGITGDASNGFVITNTLTGLVDIDVSKVWQDDNDANDLRPDDITVRLWRAVGDADPDEVEDAIIEPDDDGNWAYTFEDQDKYDGMGRLYIYSISEDSISGYAPDITGDADVGFEITNTLTGLIDIDVTKVWVDDDDALELRPEEITIRLWQAIAGESPVEVDDETFGFGPEVGVLWDYTFEDWDMFDSLGRLYIYSISEDSIDGYASVITGNANDGFDVTNTLSGEIDIDVSKLWQDDDDALELRPDEITIRLWRAVAGNTPFEVDDQTFGPDDEIWAYTFEGWDQYDLVGRPYIYIISEDSIDGYSSVIAGNADDGFIVTNTLADTLDIAVSKIWLGDVDDLDDRPDSITVRLWRAIGDADLEEAAELTFGAVDGWLAEFTDMPVANDIGQIYRYSLTEDAVEGYLSSVSGQTETGFVVTNVYIEDEDIPLATPTPTETPTPTPTPRIPDERIPQTGEGPGSNSGKWLGLFLLGTAIVVAYSKRRIGQIEAE